MSDAVIIEASDTVKGIITEYRFIETIEGAFGTDWIAEGQALIEQAEKSYDELTIHCRTGDRKTYYFDISSFHGAFRMRGSSEKALDKLSNPNFDAWIEIASKTVNSGALWDEEVETIWKLSQENDSEGFTKLLESISKRPPIPFP